MGERSEQRERSEPRRGRRRAAEERQLGVSRWLCPVSAFLLAIEKVEAFIFVVVDC